MKKIGMWMYQNGGGVEIEKKLVKKLYDRGIDTITGLNLRDAIAKNDGIYIDNLRLNDLDLSFHITQVSRLFIRFIYMKH